MRMKQNIKLMNFIELGEIIIRLFAFLPLNKAAE